MDAYRGFAVLLVVIGHSTGISSHVGFSLRFDALDGLWGFFRPYRMPLMFFLSGTLLAHSLRKGAWTYTRGKLKRVVWPYLLWSLLTLTASMNWEWFTDPLIWDRGPVHMWFLRVLIVTFAVAPLMLIIPPWALVFAAVALTVTFEPNTQTRLLGTTLFWPGVVFLGAALLPHFPRIQRSGKWLPWLAGLLALWVSSQGLAGNLDVTFTHPWSMFLPVPGFLLLIWLGPRLPRIRFLEFAGRRSIVYYCAHVPVIYLVAHALKALQATNDAASWLIILTATLLTTTLLSVFYGRVKWLFDFPDLSFSGSRDQFSASPAARHRGRIR